VIDGKLERSTMTGSWDHGNLKGDFKITKKEKLQKAFSCQRVAGIADCGLGK